MISWTLAKLKLLVLKKKKRTPSIKQKDNSQSGREFANLTCHVSDGEELFPPLC
jgi:hypothetical protein